MNDFEDVALTAWNRIGNRNTRLYRYTANTSNGELILPCNADEIESVHIPLKDAQITSNVSDFGEPDNVFIEAYIDNWKLFEDPIAERGKFIKYHEGDGVLYFNRDYRNVTVVYKGVIVDPEDGLPLINEKESQAIAAFVAYSEIFKDSIRRRDKNAMAVAQTIKEDWLRRCNAARIPEHISQNEMDAILDVSYRWDRKQFGKSFKPIL